MGRSDTTDAAGATDATDAIAAIDAGVDAVPRPRTRAKLSAPLALSAPTRGAPVASVAHGARRRQEQQAPRGPTLLLQLAGSPAWLPADGAAAVALAARDGALLA
ncbi:MAG: hypothetical protein MUC68_17500, partial [Burkholderiaceae bacterium]|nr:hypothetical protein [Burkholderiaceae bacterium]